MAGYEKDVHLLEVPTYRVALAFAGFILISLILEKGLHLLQHFLEHRRLSALVLALDKIRGELMILGFLSILLLVFGGEATKICVDTSTAYTTCKRRPPPTSPAKLAPANADAGPYSPPPAYKACPAGKEPWISLYGLKDLDIFIFCLAVMHIVFSVLACCVAYLKVRQFFRWEEEHQQQQQKVAEAEAENGSKAHVAHVPGSRIFDREAHTIRTTQFSQQASHLVNGWLLRDLPSPGPEEPLPRHTRQLTFLGYLVVGFVCFFHQFYRAVRKPDYLAVRKAFMETKGLVRTYDFAKFQRHIMMNMFVSVVGASWWLWAIAGVLLLANFQEFLIDAMALVPVALCLIIGCKMQTSLYLVGLDYLGIEAFGMERLKPHTSLAQKEAESQKSPVTQAVATGYSDADYTALLFWFGRPGLILLGVQYIIFQCAYQATYIPWAYFKYSQHSCVFDSPALVLVRLGVSLVAPFLTAYVMLPVFSLLSAMDPRNTKHILSSRLDKGLEAWRNRAQGKNQGH